MKNLRRRFGNDYSSSNCTDSCNLGGTDSIVYNAATLEVGNMEFTSTENRSFTEIDKGIVVGFTSMEIELIDDDVFMDSSFESTESDVTKYSSISEKAFNRYQFEAHISEHFAIMLCCSLSFVS